MKHTRRTSIAASLALLVVILLTACGPKDTGPVTLTISGLVDNPLSLTDAGLHAMDVVTATLEHPKDGPIEYTGVLLSDLLAEAGIQEGATMITLLAADGYSYDLALADAQACSECMITFAGEAGDYTAAMPGMANKAWVKTLVSIEVK